MVKLFQTTQRTMELQTEVPQNPSRTNDAVRLTFIALAYFLAHQLAFLFPDSQRVLTVIWPAGGIGLAAFLLSPRRLWPAIAAVLFVTGSVADVLSGRPLAVSLGFMAANAIESAACAWLISNVCGTGVRFRRVREALALIGAAVFVNAATAFIGAGTAALTGTASFWNFWFDWWVEDALGILLVTPLIVVWSESRELFRGFHWGRFLEGGLLLAVLCMSAWFAFQPTGGRHPLVLAPYLLLALLTWSGLRFEQRGVALSLAIVSVIAVTSKGLTAGPSPLGGASEAERLLALQIYLALIACMGLLLASAWMETRTAEARVRILGDNLPQGAVYQVMLTPDGIRRFLYVSAGMEALTGVRVDEILRDPQAIMNLIPEEDRAAMAAAEQAALSSRTVFRTEVRMRRRDGQIRWMHLTSSPRDLGDGQMIWDGIQTDVTERKRAEDDLQAAHAELTAIHAHAPVTLLSVGEDLRLRTVHDLPGMSANRVNGDAAVSSGGGVRTCLSALADPAGCGGPRCESCPVRIAVLDSLRNRTRHEAIEAWLPVTSGGETESRCFLLFTGPLQLRESRSALVCVLDITASKRAELELRNSEARFRTLTEGAPVAFSMSRAGSVVYANPAYLKMFGFDSMGELAGLPTLERFAPSVRDRIAEQARRREQELPVPSEYESIGYRRDGSEFPMQVAVIRMQFGEGPALVAFITDLTASKLAEEERAKLEEQLRRAQKLESIGRLAGGIAHDFNNLLMVINGFSALLVREMKSEDRLSTYAEQIRVAGETGAGLTRQLLAFSRQEAIQPMPANLNVTVAQMEPMLLSVLGENITFVKALDADLGQVLVDPAQINQILVNLVTNSRDAMPRGGVLEIATRNLETKWVVVTVTDTGIGMNEATRQNIFEPFFTTKGLGKGTGLGLATVYGVMQQNAGWIDVQSEPGLGTTFTLYFPRIAGDLAVPPAPVHTTNGSDAIRGGETILVVEDQDAVREFLRTVLEGCGYKVLAAGDGEAALRVADAHGDEIQLLLTDVIMPGMNGKEMAERLSAMRPGLRTIFMSGYLADVIADSGVMDLDVAFLQKPVDPEVLAAKVRETLAASASA